MLELTVVFGIRRVVWLPNQRIGPTAMRRRDLVVLVTVTVLVVARVAYTLTDGTP